jgi:hypothetical protein
MTDHAQSSTATGMDAETVRALCGDVSDSLVSDILATGASVADLEKAAAWASGAGGDEALARHPLDGKAAQVFDLLASEAPPDEEP